MKELSVVSWILSESLSWLSDEQQNLALKQIFWTDAIRTAVWLANVWAESFENLSKKISNVDAWDIAKKRLDNLSWSVTLLFSKASWLAISIWEKLKPAISWIISIWSWFITFLDNFWGSLLKATTIVWAATIWFFAYTGAIWIASTATAVFWAAIALFTWPVWIAIGAIATLTAWFSYFTSWVDLVSGSLSDVSEEASRLWVELDWLKIKLEELDQEYKDWKLTLEEYTKAKKELNKQIEDNEEKTQEEIDTLAELNKEYNKNQKEVEENKKRLKLLQPQIERLTKITNNARLSNDTYKNTLIKLQKEYDELVLKNRELDKVQRISITTQQDVNDALNSFSTAEWQEQFKKLQQEALNTISAFIATQRAALAISQQTWWLVSTESLNISNSISQAQSEFFKLQSTIFKAKTAVDNTTTDTTTKKTGSWWTSWKSKAEIAEEEAKKEAEKLREIAQKEAEEAQELEDNKLEKIRENDEKIRELAEKTTEFMKQQAFDQFDSLKKQIDDTDKKINDFNNKIQKLQADLASVSTEWDIAKRAVEIQEALKEQNIQSEKRVELEKELALALASTTQSELDRATLLAEESQTEKIIREAEERRADLERQIEEAIAQRDEQVAIQQELLEQKQQLEQDFTNQFQVELDKRKNAELSAIQEIMESYRKLREERASLTSSLTTTEWQQEAQEIVGNGWWDFIQTNEFNITDATSAEDVLRALWTSLPK